jgi:hypothetical protein
MARGPVLRDTIYDDLEKLTPPRKHYQRYYQREGERSMWHPPQLHAFSA